MLVIPSTEETESAVELHPKRLRGATLYIRGTAIQRGSMPGAFLVQFTIAWKKNSDFLHPALLGVN